MTKGIAIQTILMLLVGILVVGIIVYMVYRYMLSPGLTEQECRSRMINWCNTCKAGNWLTNTPVSSDVTECWTKNFFVPTGAFGSCTAAEAQTYCSQFGIS